MARIVICVCGHIYDGTLIKLLGECFRNILSATVKVYRSFYNNMNCITKLSGCN
jgi:hypothetical protein